MTDKIEVTQADREAAADWLQSIDDEGHEFQAVRSGQCDNMDLVQAFARHRIASVAEVTAQRDELLDALRKVAQFNDGQKPYRFLGLKSHDRANAEFDAWMDIRAEIDATIAKAEGRV